MDCNKHHIYVDRQANIGCFHIELTQDHQMCAPYTLFCRILSVFYKQKVKLVFLGVQMKSV